MCDSGPEFDNKVVREYCKLKGIELRILPAMSPWVNGLLEGMNSKLLGCLKPRLSHLPSSLVWACVSNCSTA
jgi:hypothetical protein